MKLKLEVDVLVYENPPKGSFYPNGDRIAKGTELEVLPEEMLEIRGKRRTVIPFEKRDRKFYILKSELSSEFDQRPQQGAYGRPVRLD